LEKYSESSSSVVERDALRKVLHGDHQLMRPARFAAPPLKWFEKNHLQQLARSSSWRAASNWRARKHA
jgi:hypothetical protein